MTSLKSSLLVAEQIPIECKFVYIFLKFSGILVVFVFCVLCVREHVPTSVSRPGFLPTPLHGASALCYRFANNKFAVAFIHCHRQHYLIYVGQTFLFHIFLFLIFIFTIATFFLFKCDYFVICCQKLEYDRVFLSIALNNALKQSMKSIIISNENEFFFFAKLPRISKLISSWFRFLLIGWNSYENYGWMWSVRSRQTNIYTYNSKTSWTRYIEYHEFKKVFQFFIWISTSGFRLIPFALFPA